MLCLRAQRLPERAHGETADWPTAAFPVRVRRYHGAMSDAVSNGLGMPNGTSLLPRDLTADELMTAPVLQSMDTLLIDGWSDEEDDAFAAAIGP